MFSKVANSIVKGSQRVMFCLHMVSATLIAVLVVIIITDVLRRTLTGKALVGAVEITEFFMAGIVFLAISYTQLRDEHVKVDILVNRLPGKARAIIKITMLSLGAFFLTIVMWQGFWDALEAFNTGEYKFGPGNVRLYTWPARSMVPFGCFWFVIQLGIDTIRQIALLVSGKLPESQNE